MLIRYRYTSKVSEFKTSLKYV